MARKKIEALIHHPKISILSEQKNFRQLYKRLTHYQISILAYIPWYGEHWLEDKKSDKLLRLIISFISFEKQMHKNTNMNWLNWEDSKV